MRRRLLITGASGQLGGHLLHRLQGGSHALTAWSGSWCGELCGVDVLPVDLTASERLTTAFQMARPEVVLHTAALSSVADCYRDPVQAERVNVQATARLAELAEKSGARFVYVSTDLVFDGVQGTYREEDEPLPLSVYGRTKLAGEKAVLACPNALVVRFSLLLGSGLRPERPTFFDQQIRALRAGQPIRCFVDEWRTPLSLDVAARILLRLLEWEGTGLLHVGGSGRVSRYEIGLRLAQSLGVAEQLVEPIYRANLPTPEPRPRDTSLNSARFRAAFPDEARLLDGKRR